MQTANQMYIDGEWCEGATGGKLEVVNPANEEIIDAVSYGTRDDARGDAVLRADLCCRRRAWAWAWAGIRRAR